METGPAGEDAKGRKVVKPSPAGARAAGRGTEAPDHVAVSLQARQRLAELADEARCRILEAAGKAQRATNTETEGNPRSVATSQSARLARIRRRLATGFYDRPEVRQRLAEKLAEELKNAPDESSERNQ